MSVQELLQAPTAVFPVAYNTRDLLLYSVGIGCTDPRFVYELDSNFAAFPTYPICLTFKGDSFDALPFPSPAMMAVKMPALQGVKVGLDAEKIIEKVCDLPTTATEMVMETKLVGVHKRGSGALVEAQFELKDKTGKVYYRIISGTFLVGAKDFEEGGVSHSKAVQAPKEAPAHRVAFKVDERNAAIFRLSGDYNPLHIDPGFAKQAGFPAPILHGLCSLGHTTRIVLQTVAGGDAKRYKCVRMRFASPVMPGDELEVLMWHTSPTEVVFETRNKATGKVVISNGLMELHPEGKL